MATADIEIGKVGRVALVHVVIGVEDGIPARRHAEVEEGLLRERLAPADELVEERMEDADLGGDKSAEWFNCSEICRKDSQSRQAGDSSSSG